MSPPPCKQQHGASLIEVMIALLIFTVGLLGLAAMQLNALQSTTDSGQRSQAAWLMNDLAERMRANPGGTLDNYRTAPNCAALPATVCADYYNPATNAKVNAANCSSEQMAAFDRWEAQCSYAAVAALNPNGNSRFNSRDFLIAPEGAPLDLNNNGELSINWFSKAASNKPPLYEEPEEDEEEPTTPTTKPSEQSAATVRIIR
ncbi:type IV pilus modification protein PilV [Stutzerimonas nitrititolerans]|uniref:type IV pilus modification protein PilV n=1 Tax=Stutzerimonas nitrititolerans TaxID=2482751 RepID=UPI0028969D8E|nr:type IV pilus modification protein PilV [Stutzerimonas nitrititolerans]